MCRLGRRAADGNHAAAAAPLLVPRGWTFHIKAGIAFFWALANNAASSGEASSAKECGGWTAHGSRSRVDGDPDSG